MLGELCHSSVVFLWCCIIFHGKKLLGVRQVPTDNRMRQRSYYNTVSVKESMDNSNRKAENQRVLTKG
jgi:hypothetical protein